LIRIKIGLELSNELEKKIPFYFIILLLALINGSCKDFANPRENRLLIFLDQTDPRVFEAIRSDSTQLINKGLKRLFPCEPCLCGRLKVVQVRDNCQNKPLLKMGFPVLPVEVDPDGILPKDYQNFLKGLKGFQLDSMPTGFQKTCLYEPLCQELTELTEGQQGQGKTQVVIYSDMLENNGDRGTSLYAQKNLEADSFELQLIKRFKLVLPDLKDVEIHLVNHRNTQNDDQVRYACSLWKAIFERHGAKVIGPKAVY
jgi:hypothetical protein